MKTCLFAGSFDPFTTGHKEVVKRALTEYDFIYVAIGVNPNKTCVFSLEERLRIIKKSLSDIPSEKIKVDYFDGLLVDYVKKNRIDANIRGIRNDKDMEYEKQMEQINLSFYGDLKTVYYTDVKGYEQVSSTSVREKIDQGDYSLIDVCDGAKEYLLSIIKKYKK